MIYQLWMVICAALAGIVLGMGIGVNMGYTEGRKSISPDEDDYYGDSYKP